MVLASDLRMANTENLEHVTVPATSDRPGAPQRPETGGLVDGGERDVSDRPQGDPEVPELGAWDKRSGQLPDKDATGF